MTIQPPDTSSRGTSLVGIFCCRWCRRRGRFLTHQLPAAHLAGRLQSGHVSQEGERNRGNRPALALRFSAMWRLEWMCGVMRCPASHAGQNPCLVPEATHTAVPFLNTPDLMRELDVRGYGSQTRHDLTLPSILGLPFIHLSGQNWIASLRFPAPLRLHPSRTHTDTQTPTDTQTHTNKT